MSKPKKKSTKKKATKKISKKISKPVKSKFGVKPEFEKVLADEAKAADLRKAKELEEAGGQDQRPGESARGPGEPAAPESTIPPKPQAVRALAPVLKIPFAIWSNIENIPEIRLSTEEAQAWADPVCGILEYYFPGKIPEIAWMWLMLLESTAHVIDSRMEIRHQHKKKISAAPQPQRGPVTSENSADQPVPKHNGAEPAENYPTDG